jgi:hypothetical protein
VDEGGLTKMFWCGFTLTGEQIENVKLKTEKCKLKQLGMKIIFQFTFYYSQFSIIQTPSFSDSPGRFRIRLYQMMAKRVNWPMCNLFEVIGRVCIDTQGALRDSWALGSNRFAVAGADQHKVRMRCVPHRGSIPQPQVAPRRSSG